MNEQKLTPWFPARMEPVREGVYQVRPHPKRRYSDAWANGFAWHSVWRDGKWRGATSHDIQTALEYEAAGYVSREVYEWRGLAEEPS
jgi:hypothetical protein